MFVSHLIKNQLNNRETWEAKRRSGHRKEGVQAKSPDVPALHLNSAGNCKHKWDGETPERRFSRGKRKKENKAFASSLVTPQKSPWDSGDLSATPKLSDLTVKLGNSQFTVFTWPGLLPPWPRKAASPGITDPRHSAKASSKAFLSYKLLYTAWHEEARGHISYGLRSRSCFAHLLLLSQGQP